MTNTPNNDWIHEFVAMYVRTDDLAEASDVLAQEISAAELRGRLEAAEYFKKYMISTSPFISEILDPYIELQRTLKEGGNE